MQRGASIRWVLAEAARNHPERSAIFPRADNHYLQGLHTAQDHLFLLLQISNTQSSFAL